MKLSKIVCTSLVSLVALTNLNANEKEELGEITITGEKIEKSLQDTTTSVQVFDDYAILNSSKLDDVYDMFEQTTNVNRMGKYSFSIRGINANGESGSYMGPKTINVTVDGVSLGTNASKHGALTTWDVKQVEILKGPQSTVQGRSSLAGAVVLKTKDPEFESNGAAQVGYGTNNKKQFSIMQTGAITEDLAFRIAVDHKSSDGQIKNDAFRGDKFNESSITNVRGKLLYKPSDETDVLLTLSKLKYDDKGSHIVIGNPKDKISAFNTDGFYNTDAVSHSLEINHAINDAWNFTSLTGYSDEKFDRFSDLDYLDGTGVVDIDRRNDALSQEFKFTYTGENSESIIGLYHSRGKGTDKKDAKGANFIYNGLTIKTNYQEFLKEEFTNSAIFFNTDYHVNDALTLIVGARLDKDERENSTTSDAQRAADYGPLNNTVDSVLTSLGRGNAQDKTDTTNFMPRVGLNYKFNDDISSGFVYSKGYRPGGVSNNPIAATSKVFEAESTDNYELSFRSQLLDNTLIFNANAFYTIFKDQQVSQQGATVSPFDTHIVNAAKSTIKGIEVESKYQVNENVNIFSSVGLIEGKYDDFKDNSNDYSGNKLIKTPTMTANIGVNYRNDEGYFIGTNITHTGSQFGDTANTRKIASYRLVNLKAGYERDDWGLYAYANNLFDKTYLLNNYSGNQSEVGESRIVGVNFKYYW